MMIPPSAQSGLARYAAALHDTLPEAVSGIYLLGSIALGDFQPTSSDIDFVTLVRRALTAAEIDGLRVLHTTLRADFPACRFSGSYLQAGDLGRDAADRPPGPYYHDAELRIGHHDENAVSWWLLANRHVTLFEAEPLDFSYEMDWERFSAAMRENLATYWTQFRRPSRIGWLLTDSGVMWVVLGVLRPWYSIREHAISSKTEAGEYGLQHLPEPFHPIVGEALRLRRGTGSPGYRSRLTRATDAHRLLRTILSTTAV